jgi:hypothetical protein
VWFIAEKELLMQRIQCNQPNVTPWSGQTSKSASQAAKTTDTRLKSVSTSQNMVLNLTTDEGDKLSISLAASAQSDYLQYRETGQNADGRYARTVQMYSMQAERSYSITVDGNLSDEELSDIGQVLTSIDSMMSDFVQGRLEPILAEADKLSGLDTVSDFSIDMTYARNVTSAHQTQVQTADSLGTIYDSNGQIAESPSATALPQVAQLRNQAASEADDVTSAMAEQLAKVQDSVQKLLDALQQIFDKHRENVENSNPNDGFGPALIDRMHSDLLAKAFA